MDSTTSSSDSNSTTMTKPPAEKAQTLNLPLPAELMDRTDPFDPPQALIDLVEPFPISRITSRNGEPMWLVSGYEQARSVLSDSRFSADRFKHFAKAKHVPEAFRARLQDKSVWAGWFISMDPPDHTRYRKLLTGQFTVRRMRLLSARIEEIVNDRLDAMIAGGTTADLVEAFALPVPTLVICELLGVSYDDRADFQRRTAMLVRTDVPVDEVIRSSNEQRAFLQTLVTYKREHPSDDLMSGLIHDADSALSDDELVNISNLLLTAGHETTANTMALSTFALLERPEQLAALRADPSLIPGAVDELLRYLTVNHTGLTRFALEDVEIEGHLISAGDTVLVSIVSANRDGRQWPHPEQLDVSRERVSHLAFGHGLHQCLGQQLARVEMTVGLTQLLRRLPGLRLGVPAADIHLRDDMFVYGVNSLPVAWDEPGA